MTLEHAASWTNTLEQLREFYCRFFDGVAGEMYHNVKTGLRSYFIQFDAGARLEIMERKDIPTNLNDRAVAQHQGLIHLAFFVTDQKIVDEKAEMFRTAGINILRGPRVTGDGYYEFEMLDADGNRLEVGCKI